MDQVVPRQPVGHLLGVAPSAAAGAVDDGARLRVWKPMMEGFP